MPFSLAKLRRNTNKHALTSTLPLGYDGSGYSVFMLKPGD